MVMMASKGSVIPLFVKKATGKDSTVTDPNMTRFLTSLDQSLDLVLFAFSNAKQGDIFIQKAPASTVGDLARAIIEILIQKVKVELLEQGVKNFLNHYYLEKKCRKQKILVRITDSHLTIEN